MSTIKEILERISERTGFKKDVDIASVLGVPKTTLSTWKQRNSIPYEMLIEYAKREQIALDWLILGRDLSDKHGYIPSLMPNFCLIPRYDVEVSAGSGIVPDSELESGALAFSEDWIRKQHLNKQSLALVSVTGDSMEPRLKTNDLVLIDMSKKSIVSGQAFVIRINEELLVKYLQQLPNGQIQVNSQNPIYTPYIVEASELIIIGQVVASSQTWG